MLFTIQFKAKGQTWANDLNFQPTTDRASLALKVQELAKANPGTAFRVLTTKGEQS